MIIINQGGETIEEVIIKAVLMDNEANTPGISIAIAKDGMLVYTRGYGKADVELNVDATTQTILRLNTLFYQ